MTQLPTYLPQPHMADPTITHRLEDILVLAKQVTEQDLDPARNTPGTIPSCMVRLYTLSTDWAYRRYCYACWNSEASRGPNKSTPTNRSPISG